MSKEIDHQEAVRKLKRKYNIYSIRRTFKKSKFREADEIQQIMSKEDWESYSYHKEKFNE